MAALICSQIPTKLSIHSLSISAPGLSRPSSWPLASVAQSLPFQGKKLRGSFSSSAQAPSLAWRGENACHQDSPLREGGPGASSLLSLASYLFFFTEDWFGQVFLVSRAPGVFLTCSPPQSRNSVLNHACRGRQPPVLWVSKL